MHFFSFFFFNDTATTEIYTLSLHDALPICQLLLTLNADDDIYLQLRSTMQEQGIEAGSTMETTYSDRKSTRLNSSHLVISYAVFCLKKKYKTQPRTHASVPTNRCVEPLLTA